MFKNIYEIKVAGKDVKRFVKSLHKKRISFEYISFNENNAYLKLEKQEYEKILEIKTIYDIKLIRLHGPIKYLYLFKKYFVFILSSFFGVLMIILLSNIIFDVEIVHSSSNIQRLISKELKRYGIEKYHLVKSFDEQERIVKMILDNNKNTLEWLEIERIGTKYRIRVEERIINEPIAENIKYHLVARKDGIITKIQSTRGEIVKKIGDYVKKNDIIVSGHIYKEEEIKNTLGAKGTVFAETWYTVVVEIPKYYYEEISTGKDKYVLSFNFLNNRYSLFSSYKDKRIKKNIIMNNNLLPISLSFDHEYEIKVIDEVYTMDSQVGLAFKKAREKLKQKLGEDAEIIYEKKLKTIEKNSTIEVSIFYKVNENITDYMEINYDTKEVE